MFVPNRLGQGLRLVALDSNETQRSGCIGFDDPSGPIGGFAEVDPNGMFASPDECDRLAAEVSSNARRMKCRITKKGPRRLIREGLKAREETPRVA